MSAAKSTKDLAVLVADIDIEFAVRALLDQPKSLRTRSIVFDIFRHPNRDNGCRTNGEIFVRSFRSQYNHVLVVFDHEGSGRESQSPTEVERDLTSRLVASGWDEKKAGAIVIAPELENWFWSDSPHVDDVAGWQGREPSLQEWLRGHGWWAADSPKPERPKEALRVALRQSTRRPSPSLFSELAGKVSLNRRSDPAFLRFVEILRTWFPPES